LRAASIAASHRCGRGRPRPARNGQPVRNGGCRSGRACSRRGMGAAQTPQGRNRGRLIARGEEKEDSRRMSEKFRIVLRRIADGPAISLIVVIVAGLIWELAVGLLGVRSFILPAPSAI